MNSPTAELLLQWGVRGSEPGALHSPIDIAINGADEIFVTDFSNQRVQKFNRNGEVLDWFEVSPKPGGMALDRQGNLYISHFGSMMTEEPKMPDKVTVWSPSAQWLREWGDTGTAPGEFRSPGGIAIGQDERLYIADQTNRRIQVFDTSGRFLTQWGEYGIEPGQFGGNISPEFRVGGPQFVALDSSRHVYTTEGSVGRIQKFTSDGEFVLAWGDNETTPGSFGDSSQEGGGLQGPICIHVDQQDTVWVSSVSGRIQRFSSEGQFLCDISQGRGNEPGQFHVPHGLATDSFGDLYVVDTLNHRIQKFRV